MKKPPQYPVIELSVVVPTYNEEKRIANTIKAIRSAISDMGIVCEIVIADDGSTDNTIKEVTRVSKDDPLVRVLALSHKGKGAAVKLGMLYAEGEVRIFSDADLSLAPTGFKAFFDSNGKPLSDVVIASREAKGAVRISEPTWRHIVGKIFNFWVKLLVIRGIDDTQCGFKLFSKKATEVIFPQITIDGFGFDVQSLYIAKKHGFCILEQPVTWHYYSDSRVGFKGGINGFIDVLRIATSIAVNKLLSLTKK